MDTTLADGFRDFTIGRVGDLIRDIETNDPETTCCDSYLRGFQDAMKILAGG